MTASSSARSFRATLTGNYEVSPGYRLLELRPEGRPPKPKPGQFYMVATGPMPEPLLKRPFCYFDHDGQGSVSILYKVQGKGTQMLSALSDGVSLDVLGPLGNSYPMPKKGARPIIVAGGIGIASVMPLIKKFGAEARVVFGARSREDMVMREEVSEFLCELHGCTDDGSVGLQGTVVDMLGELEPGEESVIYACGPKPMTRAVVEFASERGLKGYASLEENMACGIGACMGCVVMTRKGYRRVCKEGPVFRLEDLAL
jgi:dihydroorotate dehydrogenase electron transfer subunit